VLLKDSNLVPGDYSLNFSLHRSHESENATDSGNLRSETSRIIQLFKRVETVSHPMNLVFVIRITALSVPGLYAVNIRVTDE
jgi:hypothetical protein